MKGDTITREVIKMSVVIHTADAPAAIGPYVQGRVCGNTLYTSGCIAIDPHGGPAPESVEDQTRLCLKNLEAIVKAAGFEKTDIVRCGCFLANMDDFQKFNAVYSEFFGEHKPCRTTIQAGKLPANKLVEVDCIAVKA